MNRNITALILIVIAVGIYFTYTKGVINDALAVKAVNDQYASAIDSAQQLIDLRDKLNDAYNNIAESDRDKLDKMIPSTVDNIRLIISLSNIAKNHNQILKNVKAAVSGKSDSSGQVASNQAVNMPMTDSSMGNISTPTLDTVDVTFSVSAPYNQFIAFMQDLEANLRIMDLKHLSMTANDTGIYDFGVNLTTYWIRQ